MSAQNEFVFALLKCYLLKLYVFVHLKIMPFRSNGYEIKIYALLDDPSTITLLHKKVAVESL